MPDPTRCPKAQWIEGAVPGAGGVVCQVLEHDASLMDGVAEGAPTSSFIRESEDPSMLRDLCCGQGEPLVSPDDMAKRPMGQGHYSGCPIYAAWVETNAAMSDYERTFKPKERPSTEFDQGYAGRGVGERRISDDDMVEVHGATEGPNAREQ